MSAAMMSYDNQVKVDGVSIVPHITELGEPRTPLVPPALVISPSAQELPPKDNV